MVAASFVQFTGWMATLAVALAVIAGIGLRREHRKAVRMFEELNRIRNGGR